MEPLPAYRPTFFASSPEALRVTGLAMAIEAKTDGIARQTRAFQVDPASARPLKPLCDMLLELRELHRLNMSRATINRMAHQIIHRLEQLAPAHLARMNVEDVQEVVRWGLSQATMDRLLLLAVQNNRPLTVVQALVARKANVHQICEGGRTLLMEAAHLGNLITVRYLLSQDLNPRARDDQGRSSVQFMHGGDSSREIRLALMRFDNEGQSFINATCLSLALSLFVGAVAPIAMVLWNTIAHIDWNNRQGQVMFCYAEVGISTVFACFVFGVELSGLVYVIYVLSLFLFATDSFSGDRIMQTLMIDYISPLVKMANYVSIIAMMVLGNIVYGGVMFAFYTISLLDSYGYLPVSIQRVYYTALKVVFTMPMKILEPTLKGILESLGEVWEIVSEPVGAAMDAICG